MPGATPGFIVDIGAIAQSSQPGLDKSFQWLLGWIVMIVLIIVINKSRLGHVIIYYSLWLMLIFLLVSQGPGIGKVLGSIGQPSPE